VEFFVGYFGVYFGYVIVCFVEGWNLLCVIFWGVVYICNCVFGWKVEFVLWGIAG
jgi:hypothetical protein